MEKAKARIRNIRKTPFFLSNSLRKLLRSKKKRKRTSEIRIQSRSSE